MFRCIYVLHFLERGGYKVNFLAPTPIPPQENEENIVLELFGKCTGDIDNIVPHFADF